MALSPVFKKFFWIIILTIVQEGLTYACDGLSQSEGPKIIKISVRGANEFAEKLEEYLKIFLNSLLLTDGDGVYTRVSKPTPGPDTVVCPRGDMPAYFYYLHEARKIPMILASAWNKPEETFNRVKCHHLGPTFNLHKTIEEGTKQFGDSSYFYVKKAM